MIYESYAMMLCVFAAVTTSPFLPVSEALSFDLVLRKLSKTHKLRYLIWSVENIA